MPVQRKSIDAVFKDARTFTEIDQLVYDLNLSLNTLLQNEFSKQIQAEAIEQIQYAPLILDANSISNKFSSLFEETAKIIENLAAKEKNIYSLIINIYHNIAIIQFLCGKKEWINQLDRQNDIDILQANRYQQQFNQIVFGLMENNNKLNKIFSELNQNNIINKYLSDFTKNYSLERKVLFLEKKLQKLREDYQSALQEEKSNANNTETTNDVVAIKMYLQNLKPNPTQIKLKKESDIVLFKISQCVLELNQLASVKTDESTETILANLNILYVFRNIVDTIEYSKKLNEKLNTLIENYNIIMIDIYSRLDQKKQITHAQKVVPNKASVFYYATKTLLERLNDQLSYSGFSAKIEAIRDKISWLVFYYDSEQVAEFSLQNILNIDNKRQTQLSNEIKNYEDQLNENKIKIANFIAKKISSVRRNLDKTNRYFVNKAANEHHIAMQNIHNQYQLPPVIKQNNKIFPLLFTATQFFAIGLLATSLVYLTGGLAFIPLATHLTFLIATPIFSILSAGIWHGLIKPLIHYCKPSRKESTEPLLIAQQTEQSRSSPIPIVRMRDIEFSLIEHKSPCATSVPTRKFFNEKKESEGSKSLDSAQNFTYLR